MLYKRGTLVFARSPKGLSTISGCTVPFTLRDPQFPKSCQLILIRNGVVLIVIQHGCVIIDEHSAQYEVMLPDATTAWVWSTNLQKV